MSALGCKHFALLLSLVAFFAASLEGQGAETPARTNPPAASDYASRPIRREPRVHDPSTIIKENGDYRVFATGQGVISQTSKDLVNWTNGPAVMDRLPEWAAKQVPGNRGHLWAPDVVRISDRYFLYYSISTWGKRTSAIGLVTNPTLDPKDPNYKWTDAGMVVSTTEEQSDHNAIDPSVLYDEGKLWMAYGSYWSGIKVVELDPLTGLRLTNSPLHSVAWNDSIEAAALLRHGKDYFLFVNWGRCCAGTNSTYEIRMGRSQGVSGPYKDKSGKDMMEKGGTLFLATEGRRIGPGHAGFLRDGGKEYVSYHYYDRDRMGRSDLEVRELKWDKEGWPVPGSFVSGKAD